jgi:hypothetical protein
MTQLLSRVRFQERSGRLQGVEVQRTSARPIVSALHGALFALGIVVTSYQAVATPQGLRERLQFSSVEGGDLDDAQSENARAAILPLVLNADAVEVDESELETSA